ncbi:zinc ribbon domain-containing protein [Paenibacillus sp. EC2-1]|uniref:zinc ribbon domain-containing protein n=1 Tax=Paenibacillus sp. EC2-1 TaxID=3388665 RepID=UPI003BEEDC6F
MSKTYIFNITILFIGNGGIIKGNHLLTQTIVKERLKCMVICPWCAEKVIIVGDICPECRMEVLPEHLNAYIEIGDDKEPVSTEVLNEDYVELSIEERIEHRFNCVTCGGTVCEIQEVAMSGTGLNKVLDIDYNHYLFVSCLNCGIVVVYNPDILRRNRLEKS